MPLGLTRKWTRSRQEAAEKQSTSTSKAFSNRERGCLFGGNLSPLADSCPTGFSSTKLPPRGGHGPINTLPHYTVGNRAAAGGLRGRDAPSLPHTIRVATRCLPTDHVW